MTHNKKIGLGFGAVLLVVLIGGWTILFPGEPKREPPAQPQVSAFQEVPVPFRHRLKDDTSFSFLGAAAIDVDGDGRMEVFVGGGQDQADVLLAYRDGKIVDVMEDRGLSDTAAATFGATSIDLDADGDSDLLVGRNDGVTLYLNEGGRFSARKIDAKLAESSNAFAVSVADYDQDGDGDLYISVFIDAGSFVGRTFNDPSVTRSNRLLRNEGDLRFVDVTEEMVLAGKQNTFQSVWVDLDNDGFQDLAVAPNTGQVEIYRNQGGQSFEAQPPASAFGFWMCAAAGDIDNDGDQDLFFSNAGNVLPASLLTGDLRDDQPFSADWLLLRNEGGFRFSDVTAAYGLDGYGFAWGGAFEDLNLDGQLDLIVSQNAEKLPMHRFESWRPSSKAFLQLPNNDEDNAFFDIPELGLQRPDFGQAPLYVDLDGDGRRDVLMLNQNQPARAYLNRHEAKTVTVALPDTVSSLGARVVVETDKGKSGTREYLSSAGFMTDSSPEMVFAVGDAGKISVIVHWPGIAAPQRIDGVAAGQRVTPKRPEVEQID